MVSTNHRYIKSNVLPIIDIFAVTIIDILQSTSRSARIIRYVK